MLGFFHRWLEEFAKHCEQVTVICLRQGAHELPENVRVFPLGSQGKLPRTYKLLRGAYRFRGNYDVVFVHMNPEYILAAGWLWQLLGKRIGLWYMHKSTPWRLRAAMPFVDRVFTGSTESFRLHSSKVQVMGHGIDTKRVIPLRTPAEGVLRLFSSGRVSPIKHVGVLIDAYLLLKQQRNTSLVYFGAPATSGDVVYQEQLRARLLAAGENPATILPGPLPHEELPSRRAHADYFLHASETGSLDKSILDAIISGLLPVSSSEACASLFQGFEDRLMYRAGDATALAARIRALEQLPEEEREHMRQALTERVIEQHSLSTLIPRIVESLSVR